MKFPCRIALVLLALLQIPDVSHAHSIVIGGGPEPEGNQVSLEQDIDLARTVFGKGVEIFFAAGEGAPVVQVLAANPPGDDLEAVLGEVFDPRPGRDSRYRPTRLEKVRPATLANITAAVRKSLSGRNDLFVYGAMHGNHGQVPNESRVDTWGGEALNATALAAILDESTGRGTTRIVLTACHSGGFAELAFVGADAERGPARTPRCGLFAADWDQIAGGCDPNPNRGAQDGYGVHFLNALRGQNRDGMNLDPTLVDFDGDGKISLLEAHTRARIESSSFGVPITTSERWLRAVSTQEDSLGTAVSFPEEDAVIRLLGERTGLPNEVAVNSKLDDLRQMHERSEAAMREASVGENEAASILRIALLEKWPVLDDPWHPDFSSMLDENRAPIRHFLETSAEAAAYQKARSIIEELGVAFDALEIQMTLVARLARAYETRRLVSHLQAAGGEPWKVYERLRTCERWVPANR